MWVQKSNKTSWYKIDYICNPSICACEINRCFLKSIDDDLVITCDEIINVLDNVSINLNDKKQHVKWIVVIFYWLFY